MSPRFVGDASALVALLLDDGPDGHWATDAISGHELLAPTLVGYETADVIRRHEHAGHISPDQAAQAHQDLLDLSIEHWPHDLLATRAWQLRDNLSIYDASYVALAELTDATLVTLDRRIKNAPGPRCAIATP